MLIDAIFQQKMMEIQSRVPVQIQIVQKATTSQPLVPTGTSSNKVSSFDVQLKNFKASTENTDATTSTEDTSIQVGGNETDKSSEQSLIESAIYKAAKKYDVPAALIAAVIRQESNFNPKSVSHCGAIGLMQLMPQTAAGLGVTDPYDIEQNINAGTKYLKRMITQFKGDFSLALAAYNAGPGAVRKHDGIPPYKETQTHVKKVMKYYQDYKYQYAQK